ncbi:sigma 54-interacting transcriptional regulator [Herbaspirillum sp. GCM10030257]|uniref:sigma 54-interacting transcriptional regulator n=1 Tax=Herbaspirillum sp. GCM10030257 TaxID=3273393 RepID=UPI00360F2DF4
MIFPEDLDLRRLIRFSPDDGSIWLAESRMLLLHTASLGSLREEMMNSVGQEFTRRMFTRMGFASGKRDAELARKIRGNLSIYEQFATGPQMHMLEGGVQVIPVFCDMDVDKGEFHGEFIWRNSWEADAHVNVFGPQQDAVCWGLLGYASGYTSAFMGRFILFKETKCVGCSHDECRIVGKPVEEWPDAQDYVSYFEPESIMTQLLELSSQVEVLRSTLKKYRSLEDMIGESPSFRQAYRLVEKAAETNVTVLLTGETGVGKERFARAIHSRSRRANKPFVTINCAALPHDLIEAELFGVEKGAYTGAASSRAGKFERADGGTLFLDELGELPLASQAKLLRALQEGEIERLGDDHPRKVDVRIIAATNVDLPQAVKAGRFRADLYYRLSVYPILIPPLRERRNDIPSLVSMMVEKFCALHEKRVAGVTDQAMQALLAYDWPGNVRELGNMIERGVILAAQGDWIECRDLFPNFILPETGQVAVDKTGALEDRQRERENALCDQILCSGMSLQDMENMVLREAVMRCKGNLSGAARLLGITRPQLSYRLKRCMIDTCDDHTEV